VRLCRPVQLMAEMWQPQCSTVSPDGTAAGGSRQEDDRVGMFAHESLESRFSPVAMLQSQVSRYSLPSLAPPSHLSPSQQHQQHLTSLYEQQLLQQRYQHHYQQQQQQVSAGGGYGHQNSAGQNLVSTSPQQQLPTHSSAAPTSVVSRTTKTPDDQVLTL